MADRAQWVKNITGGKIPLSSWGSFRFTGLSAFKSPSSIPSRNTVCVDNYDSTKNYLKGVKSWYPSPYMTGVQAVYDVNTSDKDKLLTHIFPVAWWDAARIDLKYLVANQPKTQYEEIAWTIHVGWLVYHMLLASNVYPTLWADAINYAKNPDWVPPAIGWNMALPRSSEKLPVGYPGTSNTSTSQPLDPLATCWLWNDPGLLWTTGFSWQEPWDHKIQPGSMQNWDKQLWWSGEFSVSITLGKTITKSNPNLGLAINEIPWSGKTLYATYAPTYGSNALPIVGDTTVDNWADKNGLGLLQSRARFFHRGGLADLAKIYTDAPIAAQKRLKQDWNIRAISLVNVDYWKMVRGGATSWKFRTGFPLAYSDGPSSMGANPVILMPTARQDLKVIYNEFLKSWRQSFIVGPLLKVGQWFINAIKTTVRGDFVGFVRAQVDLQKWSKAYAKQTESAPADPYFFFTTMPPLFLRSPGDAFNALKNQVVIDENKEVTETGTEALYTLTESSTRALEKTLGVSIWEAPAVASQAAAVEKYRASVQLDPTKKDFSLSTSNKIWWGLGGLATIAGLMFWRRK